jgi:signal transduction histidine kinase
VQVTLDAALSLGLGLLIVQKTIHEHSGEITARNRPRGGAMVTITLPLPEWT